MYQAFLAALDSGNLLEPAGNCADDYYRQLAGGKPSPSVGIDVAQLCRCFAGRVQQTLNVLMESDPTELTTGASILKDIPATRCTWQRSLELIGENHYLYKTLLVGKLYFEAYALMKQASDEESDPVRKIHPPACQNPSCSLPCSLNLAQLTSTMPSGSCISATPLTNPIRFFITASKPTE
ncbi:MAG: hypothetical protein IPM82_16365 [Saprospiraceae bacterium]|nr:hypothetical protein [Saprospiraceae bacterium]